VTALYEITPVGANTLNDPLRYGEGVEQTITLPEAEDEYAYVKLRYKLPGETESRLLEWPVAVGSALGSADAASADTRFAAAVAAFGQKLRGSDYPGGFSYGDIHTLAQSGRGGDPYGYRAEFLSLVDIAQSLDGSGL
jgi:Ca-activated chloride channel family protein